MRSSRIICLLLLHAGLPACAPAGEAAGLNAETSRLSAHRRPVVSKDELRATCTGLAQTIHAEIAQMKELERTAKIEKDAPPSTVLNAWQRAFGEEGDGIPGTAGVCKKAPADRSDERRTRRPGLQDGGHRVGTGESNQTCFGREIKVIVASLLRPRPDHLRRPSDLGPPKIKTPCQSAARHHWEQLMQVGKRRGTAGICLGGAMLRLFCAFVLLLMMSGCGAAPLNPAGSLASYDDLVSSDGPRVRSQQGSAGTMFLGRER